MSPTMHLELDGHGPLHTQLTRALRKRLCAGTNRGSRLPSSRQLAQDLGVSRNTVLAAYEQLRAEGFIEARAAVGNFVAATMWTGKPTATTTGRLEPQSRYARRARRLHDHANLPSHL